MKVFIFKVENTKINKTYGGTEITAKIYQVIKNKPKYLGHLGWNSLTYMGDKSEINAWLLCNNHIPKTWCTEGSNTYTKYYKPNDKYIIMEV